MNKWGLWLSTAFWLVMMGFLVFYDVLPDYTVKAGNGYDAVLRGVEAPIVRDMVVLKGDTEVGTSQTTITPSADGTYTISNVTNVDLQVGMFVTPVKATTQVYLDETRELTKLALAASIGGKRADVSGVRIGDRLILSVVLNRQQYEYDLPYENGVISSYFEPFSAGSRLKVGQTWRTKMLDPLSQKFTTAEVQVVGKETLELSLRKGDPKRRMETYKLVMNWGTSQLAAWATEDGVILKQETPLGYTLVYRESEGDDQTQERDEVLRPEVRGTGPEP